MKLKGIETLDLMLAVTQEKPMVSSTKKKRVMASNFSTFRKTRSCRQNAHFVLRLKCPHDWTARRKSWIIRNKQHTIANYLKHRDQLDFTALKLPSATETRIYHHILEWERAAKIILIIFWDFLMFYQMLLSPQVKQRAIISNKDDIY